MKKALYLFTLFLSWHLCSKSQDTLTSKPKFYTHSLVVKVKDVDTILLVGKEYMSNTRIPSDELRVLCVKLKVLRRLEGELDQKKITIIVDLKQNEHNCFYNFEKGKTYRTNVYAFSYNSDEILKEYRKKYYKMDCYNPPVEVVKN